MSAFSEHVILQSKLFDKNISKYFLDKNFNLIEYTLLNIYKYKVAQINQLFLNFRFFNFIKLFKALNLF